MNVIKAAPRQFLAPVYECLKEDRLREALELTSKLLRHKSAAGYLLTQLGQIYAESAQLGSLVDLLWQDRSTLMNDIMVLGHFMGFCEELSAYGHFGPRIRAWISAESTPEFRSSECSHLQYFSRLSDEQKSDLLLAKYRRWAEFDSDDFFDKVEKFSTFVDISEEILQFLFRERTEKAASFDVWLHEFRCAELLKHLQLDRGYIERIGQRVDSRINGSRYPRVPTFNKFIDAGATRLFFEQLDRSRGLLLSTFHGGHFSLAERCFVRLVPDHLTLGIHPGPNQIGVLGGRFEAGFKALKALRDMKILLMGPDARGTFRQTSEIKILGISVKVADGAPTIAYESNCATGWYTMTRDGFRFVPVFDPGPQRESKETFEAFKLRWWKFYASHVEDAFRGNPRNITLWAFWARMMHFAAIERLSNESRSG